MYTNGTHPIRMNTGTQVMNIALNGGSVTYQVMVNDAWVDSFVVPDSGRYEIETKDTQGQMVIANGAQVEWRK